MSAFSSISGEFNIYSLFPGLARIDTNQLAKSMGWAPQHIRNQISKGDFPISSYLDGGKRFFDLRDVQHHLDQLRATSIIIEAPFTNRGRGRPRKSGNGQKGGC